MKAVKQSFLLLNPPAICMYPPLLWPLFSVLCDSSHLSAPFSSAALTSKNKNKAKKLYNPRGEGLKFSLFLSQVAGRIFNTDLPWQLQVCLYCPEMCVAPSVPTGRNQRGLQTGYVLMPASLLALHRITSPPANPAFARINSPPAVPADGAADCHGEHGGVQKIISGQQFVFVERQIHRVQLKKG